MDYKSILELMKEMNHTDLTKVEIEQDGTRICIEKGSKGIVTAGNEAVPNPMHDQVRVQSEAPVVTYIQSQSTEMLQTQGNVNIECGKEEIKSPMVGTFYCRPAPEKPVFVKVGDHVKKGQTLCIIEAMKLMNEIDSEFDGVITEVLMKDEQMVEYGQPLFRIDPLK